MKDIKQTTIDSVLRDYFHCVSADRLLDNNIDFDDSIKVPNSSQLYLQSFAEFLIDSYEKGYLISEEIVKILMDVIEYQGYEYMIIREYINILSSAMNILNPSYSKTEFTLSPQESKDYILKYIEDIKNISTTAVILESEKYPIDRIYKHITSDEIVNDDEFEECVYLLYKHNKPAYMSLLSSNIRIDNYIFFLLDNEDMDSLDILTNYTSSLQQLMLVIKAYLLYCGESDAIKLSDTVNKNISRLIEILSINVPMEQIVIEIGEDFDFWNWYNSRNVLTIPTLSNAIDMYKSDKDTYTRVTALDYIYKIKNKYDEDLYFYYRFGVLNMPYDLVCGNFENIYFEIRKHIGHEQCFDIFKECINGLLELKNDLVNNALKLLCIDLFQAELNDAEFLEVMYYLEDKLKENNILESTD